MIKNSHDLTKQEATELRSLTTQLSRRVSNENVEKFIKLGLARQALGGLMITDLGRKTLRKHPRSYL